MTGIKYLVDYQTPGANSKHIFYYYDLLEDKPEITTFTKGDFLNLITEAELDYLPDPATNIIWINFIYERTEKKVIEASTKTHFTVQEVCDDIVLLLKNLIIFDRFKEISGSIFKMDF